MPAGKERGQGLFIGRYQTTPAHYDPLKDSQIEGEVNDYLGNSLCSLSLIDGHFNSRYRHRSPSPRVSGDILTVTVNYNYQFLVLAAIAKFVDEGGGSFPGSITLSSTTKMRME